MFSCKIEIIEVDLGETQNKKNFKKIFLVGDRVLSPHLQIGVL
jgi:hypothetical protein